MPEKRIVRQLRGGQITIPKAFREALNLQPDDLLEIAIEDGRLVATRVAVQREGNSRWLKDLYEAFAPVREALKDVPEDEINAAIDAAVAEVRDEENIRRRGEHSSRKAG